MKDDSLGKGRWGWGMGEDISRNGENKDILKILLIEVVLGVGWNSTKVWKIETAV